MVAVTRSRNNDQTTFALGILVPILISIATFTYQTQLATEAIIGKLDLMIELLNKTDALQDISDKIDQLLANDVQQSQRLEDIVYQNDAIFNEVIYIKSLVQSAIEGIVTNKAILEAVQTVVGGTNSIVESIEAMVTSQSKVLQEILEAIQAVGFDAVTDILHRIETKVTVDIPNKLNDLLSKAGTLQGSINSIANTITSLVTDVGSLSTLSNAIKAKVDDLFTLNLTFFTEIVNMLEPLEGKLDSILSIAVNSFTKVLDEVDRVYQRVELTRVAAEFANKGTEIIKTMISDGGSFYEYLDQLLYVIYYELQQCDC